MNVRIIENSWLAGIAAKKLGYSKVAMVLGKRIYLHNTSRREFLSNRRWLNHELKHVEQYEKNGIFLFLVKYLLESMRHGYRRNRFEIEARDAEGDDSLAQKYKILHI